MKLTRLIEELKQIEEVYVGIVSAADFHSEDKTFDHGFVKDSCRYIVNLSRLTQHMAAALEKHGLVVELDFEPTSKLEKRGE